MTKSEVLQAIEDIKNIVVNKKAVRIVLWRKNQEKTSVKKTLNIIHTNGIE